MSIDKCKNIMNNIKSDNNKNDKEHKLLLSRNKSPYSSCSSEDEKDTPSPYKKKNISKKIHSKIHYDKTFHKIYHCLNFVKAAGFNSLSDINKIKIDYSNLHKYCRENEENIRAVFERSKFMVWSDNDDKLEPNEKNSLSKYVNQKLESYFGIRLSKAGSGGSCNKYEINHLFSLI
jgi:hypothetical protein